MQKQAISDLLVELTDLALIPELSALRSSCRRPAGFSQNEILKYNLLIPVNRNSSDQLSQPNVDTHVPSGTAPYSRRRYSRESIPST
jgi:hypothetical protein